MAWVTLNRPTKLNALFGDMREVLLGHVSTAASGDAVRALELTGAGRAFCAGGDIENMIRLRNDGDQAGFARMVTDLATFAWLADVYVLAAARGSGLGTALVPGNLATVEALLTVLSENSQLPTTVVVPLTTTATACLNNLGPGLGEVAAGFMTLSNTAKWISIVGMLLGRLEIFTLLVLITPTFWRH